MVTFIPAKDDWAEAFRSFGGGLSQGYMTASDERALQKSLQSLGPNPTARQVLDAVTKTKTYSPEAKQQALKNFMGVQEFEETQKKAQEERDYRKAQLALEEKKQQALEDYYKGTIESKKSTIEAKAAETKAEQNKANAIIDSLPIPDEQKEGLKGSVSLKGAESLLQQYFKPRETLSEFDKKLAAKQADEYIALSKEIPELRDTLNDINHVRELAKKRGLLGIPATFLGISKTGTELESTSYPLIKPILKMLAPSGAIAKEKLLRAEKKFAINAYDLPATIEGKLNALERFGKQALKRAEDRQKLILQYQNKQGFVPEDVLDQFDRESDTIVDAMLDYDITGTEYNDPQLPSASQYKGDEIELPDGRTVKSDGTRWILK